VDIERLSRFGNTVQERATAAWKLAVVQSEPLLRWLQLRPKVAFWAGGLGADRQRRITESFSKAVEQLSSDKLEVRLGGIYLYQVA
jgi:hypothetical protein